MGRLTGQDPEPEVEVGTATPGGPATASSAGSGPTPEVARAAFDHLVAEVRPRLRTALVARYGVDLGVEATAEAMAWAWEHHDQVAAMDNPAGYLYRVGQTAVRKDLRQRRAPRLPAVPATRVHEIDPDLPDAVATLSDQQRAAVLLVHAHGWTLAEAASVLDVSVSTLRNHLERGLRRLRQQLEATHG